MTCSRPSWTASPGRFKPKRFTARTSEALQSLRPPRAKRFELLGSMEKRFGTERGSASFWASGFSTRGKRFLLGQRMTSPVPNRFQPKALHCQNPSKGSASFSANKFPTPARRERFALESWKDRKRFRLKGFFGTKRFDISTQKEALRSQPMNFRPQPRGSASFSKARKIEALRAALPRQWRKHSPVKT